MFNNTQTRIVIALADAIEFNDAVKLTAKHNIEILKGKKDMIAGQFKTLRDRITDATKTQRDQLLQLPYEEAQREVERRNRERKIAIDRKKRARLENELLWGDL